MYLQYPLDNIWISRGYLPPHYGMDIGWFKSIGEHMPIFAPADGEVVAAVDGKGNTWERGVGDWGNYVKIYHGKDESGLDIYTLQAHMLKGSLRVKKGDIVKRGQQIGQMNNSGYSNGSHDHTEVYRGGSATSYRVDPVKYLYAYPHQYVDPDTDKDYGVLHYTPLEKVGTPVERNTDAEQVEVITDTLRARKRPELNDAVIVGIINVGVYNVLETKDMTAEASNGYLWYKVQEDMWIAENEGSWTLHYDTEPYDPDAEIARLTAEVAELTAQLDAESEKRAEAEVEAEHQKQEVAYRDEKINEAIEVLTV